MLLGSTHLSLMPSSLAYFLQL
uniref:Uncharacterized protein n=1 Tax=Anguilla anguilla TaxID=7936 RepID=A0A0E9VWR2_ANGAN